MSEFTVFDFMFNNEELENEFIKFFKANNLDPMFTNENRTAPIKVSYVDAKSVINDKGKYAKYLRNISDILSVGQNNQMYNEATFKILNEATTFQKMMNNIKRILNQYNVKTWDKHKKNIWNIVYYTKDLF